MDNTTPFAAERTWVRASDGSEVWIVAVRGSFAVADGRTVLDREQSPVSRVPKFCGPPESASLADECDLVHTKLGTDVLVHGCAFAPRRTTTTRVDVRLRVATVDKTLRVWGDRRIRKGMFGIEVEAPEPFERMPVSYERAFGGTDRVSSDPKEHGWEPRNPVGVGFAMRKESVVGGIAPNIEYPDAPYSSWQKGTPGGFGPVARHWAPRVSLAGTYDERWEKTRNPLVPADFSDAFYQCAPVDQQVSGFLKGGEVVDIHNMSEDGHFSCRLPKVTLGLTTRFYDGSRVDHRAVLHTVHIWPDKRRLEMVWHSHLSCHHKVNQLRETTILLKRRLNGSAAARG